MRHQIDFRQHKPSKLSKYGLLFKSLNEDRFPFIYQVIQYCGKPADGNASYYLNATEDYVKHMIASMPASSMKDRITSIASCTHSFPHQIGTLVSNRVG